MREFEKYKDQVMLALFTNPLASSFLGKDIFKMENILEQRDILLAVKELNIEGLVEYKPNLKIHGDSAIKLSNQGYLIMKEYHSYSAYKNHLNKRENIKMEEFYHIKLMNSVDDGEFKIDLAKDELMKRYIEPYLSGEKIQINGTTIDPKNLWRVKISKTQSSLKPLVQQIENQYKARPSIFDGAPEWRAIEEGSDVTDEIIRAPAGSKKEQERLDGSQIHKAPTEKSHIFIGHGRSKLWARLQVYLEKELGLQTHSFESESHTSQNIITILEEFLDKSSYAVIVLTAEDETAEGKTRARQNVIHEVGLFQGRLGFNKVVLLKQDELEEFTNVAGLQYIAFSKNSIEHTFYELRRTLEKAGLIK